MSKLTPRSVDCHSSGMWLTSAILLDNGGDRYRVVDIEVSDGHVSALLSPGARRADAVDASALVVLPGLCNAHYHGCSSLFTGLTSGMEIDDWGDASPRGRAQARLFRWLDEEATRADLVALYRKEFLDLLGQGVTFIADSGVSERAEGVAAEVMSEIGMVGSIECYGALATSGGRGDVGVSLHFPEEEDLDEDSVAATSDAWAAGSVPLTGHCLETALRREKVGRRFGTSTVGVLDAADLLGPSTVLFHGCLMDDTDIELVAARGASVVNCPMSNVMTSGRVAPLRRWLEAGVNVGLGTDWADTDMWGCLRAAWAILTAQGDRRPRSAADVLTMATEGGRSCYRPAVGGITVGAPADLVFVDAGALRPYLQSSEVSTMAAALVSRGGASLVRHVMVAGQWVRFNGSATRLSWPDVQLRYEQLTDELFTRLQRDAE